MGWTFVYLMLFLKLPILALLFLVWWAIRQSTDTDDERRDEGGGGGPRHPRPPLPRLPRRGPHGTPQPGPPERVRHVTARARQRASEQG